MFIALDEYIYGRGDTLPTRGDRLKLVDTVGTKACGLDLLPSVWTPPFLVLSADLYLNWYPRAPACRTAFLEQQLRKLEAHLIGWSDQWSAGIVLRSSARSETLRDRGAYQSLELAADYGIDQMGGALSHIYSSFAELGASSAIAVVVQARVHNEMSGHLSNERRVSKTVNHWMWEVEFPEERDGRFNSQRASTPDQSKPLHGRANKEPALRALFRRVGRWCTGLGIGRIHLEWGVAANTLWIFQLDVEDDQVDDGIDPHKFLRAAETVPSAPPPIGSPFKEADFRETTGWPKMDNIREFLVNRDAPYPRLCYATGSDLVAAASQGRDIAADIERMTHNHAVCRTDCRSPTIERLNLPRTDTVTASEGASFINQILNEMRLKGAEDNEICFIVHKFVPATVAAWADGDPTKQLVLIDALWGLPDGLQYLSHDTFEYDVRRRALSSEKVRYKPVIFQESETGEWRLVHVQRKVARTRCLPSGDTREVAQETHAIATRLGKAIRIMWFCCVDERGGVGRNIPWFMVDAPQTITQSRSIAPGLVRHTIRTDADLTDVPDGRCVLDLEPEASLFRNEAFLGHIVEIALQRDLPVVMRGSTLGHAYYTLERKGVTVAATESSRTRTRQRQVFKKLVRDAIPNRIVDQGEKVSTAKIGKSESRVALVIKLYEEAQELLTAQAPQEVAAELADLLEIIRSLCLATGVNFEEVERTADVKSRARGSFSQNIVLLETSWPAWKEIPKETPIESGEGKISVSELGQVIRDGKTHSINFAAAIRRSGAVVELGDGTRLSVRIVEKGIELKELQSETQLSFAFDDE